jgi:ankyrin repeat protein
MKNILITIAAVVLVGCGPSKAELTLFESVKLGDIEAITQHLADGVDINAKDDWGQFTPLHYAETKNIAELLITNGAQANATARHGSTPLASAVKRGHKEVVELLIAVGADLNTINDTTFETPLDLAKGESWEDPEVKTVKSQIADLLRNHGGKTKKELEAAGK